MQSSKVKLVVAGDYMHFYQYSHPQFYDYTNPTKNTKTQDSSPIVLADDYRAKRSVKHLVQSNTTRETLERDDHLKPVFITLTFERSIDEVEEANPLYTKFVQRLSYYLTQEKKQKLKYLVVPEFQKKTRNSVHYHSIFFNFPYVNRVYDNLREIWGLGNINFQLIRNPLKVGNYLVKYMTKEKRDVRLYQKKKYFTSRNLTRPKQYRDEQTILKLLSVTKTQLCEKNYFLPQSQQSLSYTLYRT